MTITNFPAPAVPVIECRAAAAAGRLDVGALWLYAQYLDAVMAEMLQGDPALIRRVRKLAALIEGKSGHLPGFRACVDGSGVLQDIRDARLDRLAKLPPGWSTAPGVPYAYGRLRTVPVQKATSRPFLTLVQP